MSNQEKRRLERLKKELDSQQKKLDTEKRKYQRQLKELKAEQNKVSSQKRELNAKIKKFNIQQKAAKTNADKKKGKSNTNTTGIEKKLRAEIKDLKSTSELTKKNLRETRKGLDAANDEIKILKRKIKHGGGVSTSNIQERKLKQARREIYNMKRRLKISMADLDKQSKYYESLLRRFKLDEQKWINRQREIHKEKNIIIKYVFIDDIRKLKIYKDKESRARIKTHEGHEVVIKDIEITTTTEYDEIADDVLDELMVEIESEFAKKKRKKYDTKKLENISSNDSGKNMKKRKKKNDETGTDHEEKDPDVADGGMSDMMSPVSPGFDDMKDFDDIYDDIEHEDYIDSCFHELMKEITEKTRDIQKLNDNEDIEQLLDAIQERHELIQQTLGDFQYEYVDEFPEINKNWRNAMDVLIEEKKQKTQKRYNNDEDRNAIIMKERTDVLLKVIDVLNNEQPKALLDEIMANADTEDDEEWKKVIHGLSGVKIHDMNNVNHEKVDSEQFVVCNEIMNEINSRHQDLESLRKFNDNDMEPQEEIDNICDLISKRHLLEIEKMQQIIGDGDGKQESLMTCIGDDNDKWLGEMKQLIDVNTQNVLNRGKNQYAEDELNGRIADVLKLVDIYNECKSTKVDFASLKSKFSSFVSSIRDRHEFNHENNVLDADAVENDCDWMDNIVGLASSMSGLKVKDVMDGDSMDDDLDKEEKETDDADSVWWLNQDENRNDTVDEITIDEQQQCGELYEGIMYLCRLLYYENDDEEKMDEMNDVITSLYFPIPHLFDDNEPNKHNMIAVLYDGVIFCKFINCVRDGYIDERVVNKPNAFNPFPIGDDQVSDNLQLVISSAQSLGIQLKSYDLLEWLDSNHWVQYAIDLIEALSEKHINRRLALHRNKELVRLVKNNEDPEEIRKLSGQEWLQRWCNYLNNKPVLQDILAENYNNELFTGFKLNTDDLESYESNPENAAHVMRNKYTDITNVKAQDLLDGNRKLQDLFAADVYGTYSFLDKLSEQEKNEYKSLLKSSSRAKTKIDRFASWINTALSPNITVISLLKDLSSGYIILKLLDKSSPGCVEWRNVRKKIRHKFDKINNCNLIMKICNEKLGFSLVGMAGSDIVDANEKFIISLLSQLMRCYGMRQLSAALFKNTKSNKVVTDADILQWVNLTITQLTEAQSKEISSFKDRVLSTCIIYIELLAAVKPNRIDLNLCNYGVKALVNNKVIDKQKQERTENALYCITLIRRFGGELFVIPSHLCQMESKAVLGVFAAIMTISMTQSKK